MKKIKVDYNEMATTFVGSLIICYLIFENKGEEETSRCYWQYTKIANHPERYYKSNEELYDVKHNMEILGLTRTKDWPIALFCSKLNNLLAPYYEEDGKVFALPLRNDGMLGITLKKPESVHIVKWEE